MKHRFSKSLLLFVAFTFAADYTIAQKRNTVAYDFTELNSYCPVKPRDQRPIIKVKRFSIGNDVKDMPSNIVTLLTAKLTNALQETGCFRIVEVNTDDNQDEMADADRGLTTGRIERGQILTPQAIVTAEITGYTGNSTRQSYRIPGGYGGFGSYGANINTGKEQASIAATLKIVDASTGERLYSKEIKATGEKGGLKGWNAGNFNSNTELNISEAVAVALQRATYLMAERVVVDYEKLGLAPAKPSGTASTQNLINNGDCKMLSGGRSPKVMVILPEYHIQRSIPDPAGETEIIRKLSEAGFTMIDAAMYATLRNGDRFKDAAKDPMGAISLGKDFGADIVIFGEAFSEMVDNKKGTITCRARVEAKAVRTDNAQIIATNGFDAGAQDIAESTGAKRALRNAGSKVADYMLQQFCNKDIRFNGR